MVYGCTKTVSMVIGHTYENLTLKAHCCDEVKENVEFNYRSSCRVFFKVLSSRSFFKGKWLWVSKSNMADNTSYRSNFPATAARFVKKRVLIRTFLN